MISEYEQLHELSPEEASAVLSRFLELGREFWVSADLPDMADPYSRRAVLTLFQMICSKPPLNDADISLWSMRCGYYFGEALILASKSGKLAWGLGDLKYALANHPAVVGFKNGEEAETIWISKNLILAVHRDGEDFQRIQTAVDHWFDEALAE